MWYGFVLHVFYLFSRKHEQPGSEELILEKLAHAMKEL